MKIVKVIYTAKDEFVEQNKINIKKVMEDLKKINNPEIRYEALVAADGKSFTHFAFFQSDEAHQVLNGLDSFKYFQEQLKAKGLESPPKQELLTLVGSTN